MDAAHQWHEGLSVIGIHFADSVAEGEAVWMRKRGTAVASFAELLTQLTDITHVLKLLEYDDLSWKLTGSGREFAEFLFDNKLLRPPHVTFIGGRLHFEDGFHYGYDDAVIRVNRRKKTAEVRLEIDGLAFWIRYNE